jgi:hypothetical protein
MHDSCPQYTSLRNLFFLEEPAPFSVQPVAGLTHWNRGVTLSLRLKFIVVQAMQIWIFQLAFIISIEWRILSADNSNTQEEDVEDHYDSDNGLSPEEREYRRQRDKQDAAHRAEVRENNRCHLQERRRQREADEILPIYERHDNNTPPDYDDNTS